MSEDSATATQAAAAHAGNGDEAAAGEAAVLRIDLVEDYKFTVDFGPAFALLEMDEPAPLGEGAGPNASRVLGAAVGNCLSASLLYCLRKAHIDVKSMSTDVGISTARNAKGRLRVGGLRVELHPEVAPGNEGRLSRCLELFENFCVVTESVRNGIDVDVAVDVTTVA